MASVGSMVGSGSGAGGYSAVRITAVRRPETGRYSLVRITVVSGVLYFGENNGISAAAIFDNLYRKCYNKRSDNNKNVICHQSPKFALYGVFAFGDIKSRRTAENAVQRIYIKYGNTKTA